MYVDSLIINNSYGFPKTLPVGVVTGNIAGYQLRFNNFNQL
jgi:hypothetical protein